MCPPGSPAPPAASSCTCPNSGPGNPPGPASTPRSTDRLHNPQPDPAHRPSGPNPRTTVEEPDRLATPSRPHPATTTTKIKNSQKTIKGIRSVDSGSGSLRANL